MTKNTLISRRAALRGALAGGALVTVPLPRLGAMLNGNGTAYAATGESIQRFGVYFIGNGFWPATFVPKPRATGPLSAQLPEQLAALAKVKSKLTVVSGFDLWTGRPSSPSVPHGHHVGALSGCAASAANPRRTFQLPSIDQVIARASLGKNVPFPSLELGVCNATPKVSENMYHAVSHKGLNQPNFPEYSAAAAFNRMFPGGVKPPATTPGPTPMPVVDRRAEVEKSLLDAVVADAQALQVRLGREDRLRLDSHLEGIRSLERRLAPPTGGAVSAGAACKDPTRNTMDGKAMGDRLSPELARAMADLTVLALACGQTNVFSLLLAKPAAYAYFPEINMNGGFHSVCHSSNQANVTKGVAYQMGFFGYLLEKMDAVDEGGATMLDNATVLLSTDVAWGATHTQWEWPCVIAGRGGKTADGKFRLKGDWHYRSSPSGDNFSKVLLTLANINGARLTQFGKNDPNQSGPPAQGLATEEVPGIAGY
jgi:hypothetical protein